MCKKIKYCDITGIDAANCWIVNLIPFGPNECSEDEILSYQKKCINAKIFGMGWQKQFKNSNVVLDEETKKDYIEVCGNDTSMKKALDNYLKIKIGDFAIIRLKNSHVYIGKVTSQAKYNSNNIDGDNRMSWYCTVENWAEFESSENLPSEIRGRLSQRRQPTIMRIGVYRQKLLAIKAYQTKIGKSDIPKVVISKNNFCRCLDYKQLEDLVCMYIYKRNRGYILLPSSCKINQQKYEYIFLNPTDYPVSCQVKNQNEINIEEYIGEKGFKKIYIFSGVWSDDYVEQKRAQYKEYTHIEIISPSELYDELKSFTYLHEVLGNYYEFSELDIPNLNEFGTSLNKKGWSSVRKSENLTKMQTYHISDREETIYFNSTKLWYWQEFNALFKSGADVSDADVYNVKELINNILSERI